MEAVKQAKLGFALAIGESERLNGRLEESEEEVREKRIRGQNRVKRRSRGYRRSGVGNEKSAATSRCRAAKEREEERIGVQKEWVARRLFAFNPPNTWKELAI